MNEISCILTIQVERGQGYSSAEDTTLSSGSKSTLRACLSPPFSTRSLHSHSCVSAPRVNMSALWLCTILLAALSCSARPNMPPGKKLYVLLLHTSRLCFLPQNIIHTGLSTNRLKYFTWTIQLCLPKNLNIGYSDL